MMTTGVVQQERGWVFCVHLIRDSFGDVGRHTREETPDGYVKMLLGMMLQFFIPTDFSQTCFSQKMGKNIHQAFVVFHPTFSPCVVHTRRGRFIQIKSFSHFF